jgi:hypothetical protein
MNITGVFQFPQNQCYCSICQFSCYVEQKDGKVVASHPTHPTCPNSHHAFEVPVTGCEELPQEFFSEKIG